MMWGFNHTSILLVAVSSCTFFCIAEARQQSATFGFMSMPETFRAVALLEFEESYGLGFVAAGGKIVTTFHVVAGESNILCHLNDGRSLPVLGVTALDQRRDVAVLDIGIGDTSLALQGSNSLVPIGEEAWVFGMSEKETKASWIEVSVASHHRLHSELTVYRLSGLVPQDVAGGALVDATGKAIGVVTLSESGEGVVPLVVPWKYIEPLLMQDTRHSLDILQGRSVAAKPKEYSLNLLTSATKSQLGTMKEALSQGIRIGAPVYNQGDAGGCYEIYLEVARQLSESEIIPSGVRDVLSEAIGRAQKHNSMETRAWILREVFDGLLRLLESTLNAPAPAKVFMN
jgi:serine protease Do